LLYQKAQSQQQQKLGAANLSAEEIRVQQRYMELHKTHVTLLYSDFFSRKVCSAEFLLLLALGFLVGFFPTAAETRRCKPFG
jgi:hypothetical protein